MEGPQALLTSGVSEPSLLLDIDYYKFFLCREESLHLLTSIWVFSLLFRMSKAVFVFQNHSVLNSFQPKFPLYIFSETQFLRQTLGYRLPEDRLRGGERDLLGLVWGLAW